MKVVAFLFICCLGSFAQSGQKNAPPRSDQPTQQQGESSSKNTKIDLSPPKGDDIQHADDDDNSGVMETKPWNPHKAAKDIEVGDFYAKRKNYGAAISRYREALEYKPKDAEATFKLAHVLEVTKENAEALQLYQQYLKILPNGEFAPEAQKAVERLKPAQSAAKPS
jgi:tetratricopeptide (TPR) repeat protein